METIYTIPINEAFEHALAAEKEGRAECPFCALETKWENDELDLILGASMMEPDIRIKTNAAGFCRRHFEKMQKRAKKLPLALMLESHLQEWNGVFGKKGPFGGSAAAKAEKLASLASSCYLCDKLGKNADRVFDNALYLWQKDDAFAAKVRAQNGICLWHLNKLCHLAAELWRKDKKKFDAFFADFAAPSFAYLSALEEDVSRFCRSFDYRFDEELGSAKDAVERAIAHLVGRDIDF